MPTIQTKVWMALKARVQTLGLGLPIDWPMSVEDKPQAGGRPLPYVECRHLPNAVVRRFIGSDDPHERPGILQLTICWPVSDIGTGAGQTHPDVLIQRAGEIAAHFATDLRMSFQGVTVCVERAPDVAQPYRDEAYIRVTVSIRYSVFA